MGTILLAAINAKYIHSNPAIYYLKSYAVSCDDSLEEKIHLVEFTINQNVEDVLQEIYRKQPEVVAFSCYIWNIDMVEELLLELPKVLPETDIWLGGPEVSFDAKKRLEQYPAVTGVIIGEGEATFYELAECYQNSYQDFYFGLTTLAGIVYRTEDGSIVSNRLRKYLDFDCIPFPYSEPKTLELLKNRILYYETSRGCPFSCSYCLSSVDRNVRMRSMELVKKELQYFLDAKVPQVKFVDRTFNCNTEHTQAVWEYIRKHDNGVTNFHFEIEAELLTEEELELLAKMRPGLAQLEIGIQTVNEETLCAICRKAHMEKISYVVKRLVEAGNIHIHLDLIAGLPLEDLVSFRHSFDEVYRLHPEQLQLGFLKILKGSPLEQKKEEYGIVCWDKPPYEVLSTKWLSYKDVLELKAVEEILELYYNSGQFRLTIRYMEHFYDSPYKLYHEIAQYEKKMGWSGFQYNRQERYGHLRQFWLSDALLRLDELDEKKEREIIGALLLHDLYSRENVRSRPAYAPEEYFSKQERDKRHKFFESGVYRRYLSGYEGCQAAQVSRMVHLEQVSLDPFMTSELGKKVAWNGYLLYDYHSIHAVTREASCQMLTEEIVSD